MLVYMCKLDYEHGIIKINTPKRIYKSPELLREDRKCIQDGCGIVCLNLEFVSNVKEDMPLFDKNGKEIKRHAV